VTILDQDSQRSATDWGNARQPSSRLNGITVIPYDKPLTAPRMAEFGRASDVVIIDTVPRLDKLTQSAIVVADVICLVVSPGPYDLWAAGQTVAMADACDDVRAQLGMPPVRRTVLLTKAVATSVLAREARAAMAPFGELIGTFTQRVAYPEAILRGESPLSLQPNGDPAFEIKKAWAALKVASTSAVAA
jgi:chromosome partitioning protein